MNMLKWLNKCAALVLGLAAAPVFATTMYSIDIPNSALSPFPGPYATVSVSLTDSTHATITFTAAIAPAGNFLYGMGDGGSADLQVNGSYSLDSVAATGLSNPGFTAPIFVSNTPGNVSSFGVFNLSLNFFDGFTHIATGISIDITNTSGTWASDSDVLTGNADGNFAAVHTFVCAITGGDPATCSSTAGAVVTGFAANDSGPIPRAPEPKSLALVGLGLLALGVMRRRQA